MRTTPTVPWILKPTAARNVAYTMHIHVIGVAEEDSTKKNVNAWIRVLTSRYWRLVPGSSHIREELDP